MKLDYKKIFSDIYAEHVKNKWAWQGSTKPSTKVILELIRDYITKYHIKSMADIPCGRFDWIKPMIKEVGIDYFGFDVVNDIIGDIKKASPPENTRFDVLDIVNDKLPVKVDMVLCRDLIVHLTLADGFKAINNIRASGSSFLLSTTFPTVKENKELRNQKDGFGWRPVNLSILPYSLGEPLIIMNEGFKAPDGKYADKSLGLWKL